MSSLPPAIMNSGGGTKKPFSYCPGGIDFSELKSPKIARRIAKHQAGMNEPSSTLPTPQKVNLVIVMMIVLMNHVRLHRPFPPPPWHLSHPRVSPAQRPCPMWSRWWGDRGASVTSWPLMWTPQPPPLCQPRPWARPRPTTLTPGTGLCPSLRPPHPQWGRVRSVARSLSTEPSLYHLAPPLPPLPDMKWPRHSPGPDLVCRPLTLYTPSSWPTSNRRRSKMADKILFRCHNISLKWLHL